MSLFSDIRSQIAIRDVVSEYVTLKMAGTYLKGCCPFHGERTASFTVSPHKDIFYCFGCHVGGDVIAFMAKIENCSQFEAAQTLVDRYGITITESTRETLKASHHKSQEKKQYYDLMESVAVWCAEQFRLHAVATAYGRARGITPELVHAFTIGYFPGGAASVKSLIKWTVSRGFLADDLVKAHVLFEGQRGLYTPFEERIVFPIRDHLGRYCGLGGRVFAAHDERAKYYNSRENSYFNKGSLVFGLFAAKKSMQQQGSVFLVEGYTDCIAMVQHGYPNTIATLGTACTPEHLKLLSRYVHTVYVVYDGDRAGNDAVIRLAQLCWQANLELRVITVPQGEDPASLLHKGGTLTPAIAQACDIYTFVINHHSNAAQGHGYTQKISMARTVIDLIITLQDPLKQSILMQETSRAFDIPYEVIEREAQSAARAQHARPKVVESIDEQISLISGVPIVEKKILAAILNNTTLFIKEQEYCIEYLSSPAKTMLYALLQLRNESAQVVSSEEWIAVLDERHRAFAHRIMVEFSGELLDSYDQLFDHLERHCWKEMVAVMKRDLTQAQQRADTQKMSEIMKQFQERKKKMIRVHNND